MQYVCDWCKRTKQPTDRWILGFAAESLGAAVNKTEITVCSRWSPTSAAHPLAVHFCSEQHKNAYIRLLFDPAHKRRRLAARQGTSSSLAIRGATKAAKAISTQVEAREDQPAASTRRRVRRENRKSAEVNFSETDHIRSHGLSVRLENAAVSDSAAEALTEWYGS